MALSAGKIIENALKNGQLGCDSGNVTIKSGDFEITVKEDDKKHEGFDRVVITDGNGKKLYDLTCKKINKSLFNELSAFIEKRKTDCEDPVPLRATAVAVSLGKKPRARVPKLDLAPTPEQRFSPERAAILQEFGIIQRSSYANIRIVESDASTAVYMDILVEMKEDIRRLEALRIRAEALKPRDNDIVRNIDRLIGRLRIAEGKAQMVHRQNLDDIYAYNRRPW